MKKNFLTGLTAVLLSIGFVLAGCEGPTGSDGAPGGTAPVVLVPSATATTAAGAEKYWAEGEPIVYFLGDLVLGSGGEASLTIPQNKTLILADLADLRGRAVSGTGKGSITVKANGALRADSARLVVPNGTSVTVQAGTVDLTGTTKVIVGKSAGTPAAGEAPATFAIQGGAVTASADTVLAFAKGATLTTSGGGISAASGTKFAFEDPADLNEAVVTAIKESGSTKLDVGGTIDADGTVSGATEVDPNGGASFGSDAAAFLTALSGSATLVSYTGTETVNISATTVNLTGRAVSLTNKEAELVIGTGVTVTVAGGAGVSMWAPFSGAGKITVSGTGILTQGDNYGIGGSRELVLTTTSKVTYDLSDSTLTVAGTGEAGAGNVTVTSSDGLNLTRNLTIAEGATLTLGSKHINLYAPVTLTVNGTLDAGTITLVPGSTLTVNGTVTAKGSADATGAILLGGSPATGAYTVNGTGRIKLSGSAVGPLFAVATNQTLNVTGVTLDGLSLHTDITGANPSPAIAEITGRAAALVEAGFASDAASNTYSLVTVTGAGAVLTLNTGAKVAGNTIATTSGQKEGAGVKVTSGGKLNINGGEVSYNTIVATNTGFGGGAGVFADNGSIIVMTGGSVSKNYIVANTTGTAGTTGSYGAGVAVVSEIGTGSTFTLSGGSISDNFIGGSTLCEITGGGVRVGHYINAYKPVNTFTMTGGSITGNKLQYSGSTVSRSNNISGSAVAVTGHNTDDQYISKFIMSGGTISGNTITAGTRTAYGAVYAFGLLDMSGGVIENNVATATGTEPSKGVMAVAPKALNLSGSAKIRDGLTLKPANSAVWGNTYPKIIVGTLSSDFVVSVLHLQARNNDGVEHEYSDWPNGVVLTGSGAVGAISKFPLGNFILTKDVDVSIVTAIGTANDTGYELTRDGETNDVKLTAKSGG